ncbi:MAG: kinase [Desulfovibrio sp.]|nr:kinase [Desulfovibrio sp.]
MKDVYFSPDRDYVAAFFRKPLDSSARDRLENITGVYRETIFGQPGGEYWKKLFCWPERLVEWDGRPGLVCPVYDPDFFFDSGRFRGREKEGKWFASARLRNKHLEADQKGDWLKYLQVCLNLARATRRLHAAGLAHSDLSYKNVLIDPKKGRACIIDIDGLVVPGKYPPDVVGTPDFIAPEVIATARLPLGDPGKKLPSIATDRHALAVLIYMYLLYRHPLRGPLVHDLDPAIDEELSMGSRALFIENGRDRRNRPKAEQLEAEDRPQADVDQLPYTLCGPYLSELFERAFIEGLHSPASRPAAADWETALVKTIDLIQPCQNPACAEKWFVFDNKLKPKCPFCGTPYTRQLPVLNLYWSPTAGKFKPENHRLMVYDKQSLYMWHVSRMISPNEKTGPEHRKPAGDFHFHNGRWILINRSLPQMYDKSEDKKIEPGEAVSLEDGKKILLSAENGGRLLVVQLVNG